MKKFAFLFGNSFFNDTRLGQLTAPENDMQALSIILKDKNICNFDAVEWSVNSTLAAVQTKLVAFLQERKHDELILIYYTGHGLLDEDNNLYLAMTESNAEHPDINSMSAAWMKGRLDRCRSERQLLILDCCHSGAYLEGRKSAQDILAISNDTFDQQGYGRYVLASSSRTQSSFEENGESVYTKTIVEGIKTGGAAYNKPNITVADLEKYLSERFATSTAPMRPESNAQKNVGQLIIAQNTCFVEPIPEELLTALSDKADPMRRLGAVAQLRSLAQKTQDKNKRQKIATTLEEHIDQHRRNPEDSLRVVNATKSALGEISLLKGQTAQEVSKEFLNTTSADNGYQQIGSKIKKVGYTPPLFMMLAVSVLISGLLVTTINTPIISSILFELWLKLNFENKAPVSKFTDPTVRQTNGIEPLLKLIGKHASGDNYNAYYARAHNKSDPQLTAMTLDEVIAFQTKYVRNGSPSSGMGRYGLIKKTLEALKRSLTLTGNELFDEEMQDKLGIALLNQRGLQRYLNGSLNQTAFAHNVSKEWAEFPRAAGDKPELSYYAGDGLNKATASLDEVYSALNQIKQ